MTLAAVRNKIAHCALAVDKPSRLGRPRIMQTMEVVDAILFACKTGCQWLALTFICGVSYKTIYHRFGVWSKARVFEHAFYELAAAYRLQHLNDALIADTTFVKNVCGHEVLGRTHTDRVRKSTKVSLLSDSRSVPLTLAFHCGNRSDCQTLHHLSAETTRRYGDISSHGQLHADKGYDSEMCRAACRARWLQERIPRRRTPSAWVGRSAGSRGSVLRENGLLQANHDAV